MSAEKRGTYNHDEMLDHHRLYSRGIAMTNIDGLYYNHEVPVAIVEFKHWLAGAIVNGVRTLRLNDPNTRAMRNLANMANLPFFVVRYIPPAVDIIRAEWFFEVIPLNALAESLYPTHKRKLSDVEYCRSLYEGLYNIPLPNDVARLNLAASSVYPNGYDVTIIMPDDDD
jgi:hypothetical protein